MDDLTKIVTQVSDQRASPNPFGKTVDRAGKQQNQEPRGWGERSHALAPAKPQQRSLSPERSSDAEKCLPRTDGRDASKPPVAERVLTPEEEQKRRQMQGVLQAIGLDLGFEELGQMSSRIQERLYGKKDEDGGQGASQERSSRQAFASKRRSRSWSSSRSSFSPLTRSPDTKKDSLSSQRDEAHQPPPKQNADYGEYRYEDSRSNCHGRPASLHLSFLNSSYAATQPPPALPIPTYPPKNWSEFLYPPPSPALPPSLAPVRPGFFLPPFSGVPAGLPVAPPSIYPPAHHPAGHFFPPLVNSPRFPPSAVNTVQTLNHFPNTKAKPQARPRCLQVIK